MLNKSVQEKNLFNVEILGVLVNGKVIGVIIQVNGHRN